MGRAGVVGVGVDIDILGFQLGVQDGLAGVEAVIAGEHIADAAGQGKVQQASVTKQLHGQKDRGQRAVGGTAEHRCQSQCGGKARRDTQQGTRHAAEGPPPPAGGDPLAALEACSQGNSSKK